MAKMVCDAKVICFNVLAHLVQFRIVRVVSIMI